MEEMKEVDTKEMAAATFDAKESSPSRSYHLGAKIWSLPRKSLKLPVKLKCQRVYENGRASEMSRLVGMRVHY